MLNLVEDWISFLGKPYESETFILRNNPDLYVFVGLPEGRSVVQNLPRRKT